MPERAAALWFAHVLARLVSLRRHRRSHQSPKTADPIIEPVFRLPNEMCWHVLKFWPTTCATTGEVL